MLNKHVCTADLVIAFSSLREEVVERGELKPVSPDLPELRTGLNLILVDQPVACCPDEPINFTFNDGFSKRPDCRKEDGADLLERVVRENSHLHRRTRSLQQRGYLALLPKVWPFEHWRRQAKKDHVDELVVLGEGEFAIEGGDGNNKRPTASTYCETTRFPVSLFKVWKRTFSLSEVAGDMETGQVTRESFR